MRNTLTAAYLDWFNNYLSIDTYAEHNGLTYDQAKAFLELARDVAQSNHPDS